MCCSLITCMANVRNSGGHCGQLQGMPHKWWNVPRCNFLYHFCSIGICRIKCNRSWGWNNLGKLHVEICWKRWGTCANGTDQCLILPPCCHCAESEMPGLWQCDTVSFPYGKGKVPALKLHQYSCTSWGTGGNRMSHKVTLWIYVRHFSYQSTQRIYCKLHRYNIYRKKPPTLNFLSPPPPYGCKHGSP